MFINVVSKSGKPLAPTKRPGRVRRLLKEGKARIFCYDPFTIQLTYDTTEYVPVEAGIGIDPGSSNTPIASEQHESGAKICEITYVKEVLMRTDISTQLKRRANARRERRGRLRYRKPRFQNRPKTYCSVCGKNHTPKLWKKVKRKNGNSYKWVSNSRASICRKCQHERPGEKGKHDTDIILNPTLRNKVDTIVREVEKLLKTMPVKKVRVEMAAFDTQKMANPDIQGEKYQHGTLFGYEVKEYLLLKYGHKCVYCKGKRGDPVLEVDHVIPRIRRGSDRISNLVIACKTCNWEKGSKTAEEYGFPDIQKEAAKFRAFRYSALTQSYKWALWRALSDLCSKHNVILEATFGYQTKARRLELKLPKAQAIDAMVIAAGDREFSLPPEYLVERRIKARLPYHRYSNENKKGKTCVKTPAVREVFGFKLWDKVSFTDKSGEKVTGYITGLRERGSFEISDLEGRVLADKDYKKLTFIARKQGNSWAEGRSIMDTVLRNFKPSPLPEQLFKRAGASSHV
ncbi:MAG: HNH endonuclease [Peptococcaceae bacterium]|nr:HNH endonuclease [Peptococcaceae bacterium]